MNFGFFNKKKDKIVNLLVETVEDKMGITQSKLTAGEALMIVGYLVETISKASGIPFNEILEDMKDKKVEDKESEDG